MYSKEKTRNTVKVNVKHQLPKSNSQNVETQTHPDDLIEQAKLNPVSLTRHDVMQLQRMIGNQALNQILAQTEQQPVQKESTGLTPAIAATHEPAPVVQRKGRKGKGKFSTVAASTNAMAVTNMFVQQHIGNKSAATQMAANRAPSGIEVSHTIDITETARLLNEMQQRIAAGYYVAANQVMSPHAGGMQYLTGNSYSIWETKIDNRGRLKATKKITKQFYYDVLPMAGNALHHFDGVA